MAEDKANEFLNEEIELNQFLKDYISQKIIAHERKLKLDELQAKINDLSVQRSGVSGGIQNMHTTSQGGYPIMRPAPSVPQHHHPSNVPPYPSSSFGAYPGLR